MIQCNLCNHQCILQENQTGFCRARENRNGVICCVNYRKITSIGLDPIEKKPLYHFYPGSKIFSVGSFGCNLRCSFCQNHEISMKGIRESYFENISPMDLANQAEQLIPEGNIGIAYTYNEPLIGYEFVVDTATIIQKKKMKNVLVTNACFTIPFAKQVLPYIDACNIDLKSYSDNFYKEIGGDLTMVKEFIRYAVTCCHVELTTLLIPGKNDSLEEMEELIHFIADIDRTIPYHISRFFPCYRMMDKTPTDISLVYQRVSQAQRKLENVYPGNC